MPNIIDEEGLSEREREVLKYVVSNFIANAMPVASRYIAKYHDLGLSAATIRNSLADLEERGFITHPHTSAGRIPTDLGYRFFVNALMEMEPPSLQEKGEIKKQFDAATEPDDILRLTAKLLGSISHQLSVVSAPHLRSGILEHLEIVQVSSSKIMVVLTIQLGIVKTLTMELLSDIPAEKIATIARLLNERLCGLTLVDIRDSFSARVKDFKAEHPAIINMFIRSADKIFDDTKEREKLHIGGTQSLIEQPEYGSQENIRTMIELLNNEDVLVQVLERGDAGSAENRVVISIGGEMKEEQLKNYSVVVTTYNIGDVSGRLGIIGPKRMAYQKVIPLVDFIAKEVSTSLG
ncbi:MAG TPA: heat-inducible transcriptional repressor HrcA [Bacteroidota bacterium]|nr:heat-inducible transcriptional repressor HrcA [Bacteroidota bacterium]